MDGKLKNVERADCLNTSENIKYDTRKGERMKRKKPEQSYKPLH